MNINEQLGIRIRYLRKQQKMSIEDLAIASNINRNYLSDIERGMRNPTLIVLEKIANGLHIDISTLTKGIDSF